MRITNHVLMGCITVVFFAGAVGVLPATAQADEIWVYPAKQAQNSTVGNWATAKLGGYHKNTHFAFHVPDNYDDAADQPDMRAIVVLIPPRTTLLDYTVKVNVARKDQPHTMNLVTDSPPALPVTKGDLTSAREKSDPSAAGSC